LIRDIVEMRLNRKRAYRRLFPVERGMVVGDARAILADLKKFARLPDAPIVRDGHGRVDPIASALLTGRQEVVNRILAMIHMDDRVMLNLHEDQD
jgi:hypothetical protein